MVKDAPIRVDVSDGIAEVTIDRPSKLNALTHEMLDDIVTIFDNLDRSEEVNVIILRSANEQAFSAGADVSHMATRDDQGNQPYEPMRGTFRNTYEAVFECRKPTIVALNGWVVGGGMELAMACDMRIAGRSATFLMPEAKVGLGANFGSQMLPRLVSRAHAYQILYTAEPFSSERAYEIGFVSELVDDKDLDHRVRELALTIAGRAPLTLKRYKAMINIASTLPVATALRLDIGESPYTSRDRVEGARAFREKRDPSWTGK